MIFGRLAAAVKIKIKVIPNGCVLRLAGPPALPFGLAR
jgi:hypothetical protein